MCDFRPFYATLLLLLWRHPANRTKTATGGIKLTTSNIDNFLTVRLILTNEGSKCSIQWDISKQLLNAIYISLASLFMGLLKPSEQYRLTWASSSVTFCSADSHFFSVYVVQCIYIWYFCFTVFPVTAVINEHSYCSGEKDTCTWPTYSDVATQTEIDEEYVKNIEKGFICTLVSTSDVLMIGYNYINIIYTL